MYIHIIVCSRLSSWRVQSTPYGIVWSMFANIATCIVLMVEYIQMNPNKLNLKYMYISLGMVESWYKDKMFVMLTTLGTWLLNRGLFSLAFWMKHIYHSLKYFKLLIPSY